MNCSVLNPAQEPQASGVTQGGKGWPLPSSVQHHNTVQAVQHHNTVPTVLQALTVGLLALAEGVRGTSSLCNVSHGLGLDSESEGVG